jgi:hypothetical protein
MNKKAFHFEIHDLLTQFVAAYDDVVISRYNKNRVEKERIKVRYVHAPKNRIIYDLNNKSQNLTLPVISISITSIERDEGRVFNKISGMYLPTQVTENSPARTAQIRMPVPVNVSVAVSIIGQYQTDVEQIISNFVPYSNPYIIICWKIPEKFHLGYTSEIRTEVFWSGSMALEYPIEVSSSDKARFSANTTFTIKGFLFPEAPEDPYKNIYFIDNNLKTTSSMLLNLEDYQTMNDNSYVYDEKNKILNETSTAHVSGTPSLTNVYRIFNSDMIELSGSCDVSMSSGQQVPLMVLGRRFNSSSFVILSCDNNSINTLPLSTFEYEYYPAISGYVVNSNVVNENVLTFNLPYLNSNTSINLIVANKIGWADAYSINTHINYITI